MNWVKLDELLVNLDTLIAVIRIGKDLRLHTMENQITFGFESEDKAKLHLATIEKVLNDSGSIGNAVEPT